MRPGEARGRITHVTDQVLAKNGVGRDAKAEYEVGPTNMRLPLILILLLTFSSTAEAVELTIITPKGYVSFTAADEWAVIGSQTKLPVAVMAFQIKDPADDGTPDSTNVAISLYDQSSPEGREGMKGIGKKYGVVPPKVSRVGEWQVFDQRNTQNGTEYTILDARREVADVTVSVRLAWPHLKAQARDHESAMRGIFSKLLASVHGGMGQHQPRPGETVLRPSARPIPPLQR